MDYMPSGVHVDDLEMGDINCVYCEGQILGEAFYAGELDGHLCEECVEAYVKDLNSKATEFAKNHCRITTPLPDYDDENEYCCTPEEYERGDRISNTPNAYFTMCRHEYTNYDKLIADLSKESDSIDDQVYYLAIRNRIDAILIDEIEEKHPNVSLDPDIGFNIE